MPITRVQKPDGSIIELAPRVFGQNLFFDVNREKNVYFGRCYADHNGDGRRLLASTSLNQSQMPADVDPSLYLYGVIANLLSHLP